MFFFHEEALELLDTGMVAIIREARLFLDVLTCPTVKNLERVRLWIGCCFSEALPHVYLKSIWPRSVNRTSMGKQVKHGDERPCSWPFPVRCHVAWSSGP